MKFDKKIGVFLDIEVWADGGGNVRIYNTSYDNECDFTTGELIQIIRNVERHKQEYHNFTLENNN